MSNYGTVATLTLAPGTSSTCYTYYNHDDSLNRPAVIRPSQQHLWTAPAKTCSTIASIIGIDVEQLIRLNPSLGRGDCVMQSGFSYCAEETRERRETRTCMCLQRNFTLRRLIRVTASSPSATASPGPPICHFDPEKGEYVCPEQPICTFDPQEGIYVCPKSEQEEGEEHKELK